MSADPPTSLQDRLQEDMKTALRAGDKDTLSTVRMARAAIQRRELDARKSLNDAGVEAVLHTLIKQRREAAAQFSQGGRDDLATKENAEIAVLQTYLPEPLTEAETTSLLDRVMSDLEASSPRDMGRVMAEIKRRGAGRVDMGKLSGLVRDRLQRA